jgi:hypothetical protein
LQRWPASLGRGPEGADITKYIHFANPFSGAKIENGRLRDNHKLVQICSYISEANTKADDEDVLDFQKKKAGFEGDGFPAVCVLEVGES